MKAPGAWSILLLAAARLLADADPQEPGPCPPRAGAAACSACHAGDAAARWEGRRDRPCAPYCLGCHPKQEMDKHHPIGAPLRRQPPAAFLLGPGLRTSCYTCHDLSRPRYDSVRWRAESLFDRMFRSQPRYRTYYLVLRNETGALCKACH